MENRLGPFLSQAVRAMFEDLDTFVRASLKVSEGNLVGLATLAEEDVGLSSQIALILEVGDSSRGLIILPLRAAICLGGSMMFLPAEGVKDLMDAGELDEEGLLTVNEVGNLLAGSLGRVAREEVGLDKDIRLRSVLVKPEPDHAELPFMDQAGVLYTLRLNTDRSEPFLLRLMLPKAELTLLFPEDPFWAKHGRSAPPPTAKPKAKAAPRGSDLSRPTSPPSADPAPKVGAEPPQAEGGERLDALPSDAENVQESACGEGRCSALPLPHRGGEEADSGRRPERLSSEPLPPPGMVCSPSEVLQALRRAPHQATSTTINLHGCQALLIDASWIVRRAVIRLLNSHGCAVQDCRDLRSARQVVARQHFDVILIDPVLPGESGYSFCLWLRAEGILERTALIVMSSSSTSENVLNAVQLGASYFLVKPTPDAYLLQVVNQVYSYCRRQRPTHRLQTGV